MSEPEPETDNQPEPQPETVPAGSIAAWASSMLAVLREGAEAEVPCGTCTACCRASQFIHIEPDEHEALRRIPAGVLVDAPGMPPGHLVMGYDEHGCCPMLVDDACSIYEHRPRTCRSYDCRAFAATGLGLDGNAPVAVRARRWAFDDSSLADRRVASALRAAASSLDDCAELLPAGSVPTNPPQRAVLALEIHEVFLDGDLDPADRRGPVAAVRAALHRRRRAAPPAARRIGSPPTGR